MSDGATLGLRLYVVGEAPNSVAARRNLRQLLGQMDGDQVDLEIVDLLSEPARASGDRVVVTPLLIRYRPLPEKRIVGDLRSVDLATLGWLAPDLA